MDQGILGRIFREFGVTEDEASGGVQPIDGAGGQDAEGLAVSASCPLNELRLHAWLLPKSTTDPVVYTLSRSEGHSGSNSVRELEVSGVAATLSGQGDHS